LDRWRKALGVILLIPTLVVAGCAPSYMRYVSNNGASQQQFMQDRYACYQETRERVSSAAVNRYGGAASSQVIPSCSAMGACLAARGYFRSDTSDLADFQKPGNYSVPQGAVLQCSQ
jgi:hypothetical protein